MTDDLFAPFVRAYREENPAAALDARAVRGRILLGVGSRQRQRKARLRFLVPLAATFFGSAALAASHGGLARLSDVRHWLSHETLSSPVDRSAPRRAPRNVHPATAPVARAAEPLRSPAEGPPGTSLEALPLERAPGVPAREVAAREVAAQNPTPAAVAPSVPPSAAASQGAAPDALRADIEAYGDAHRLHFHANDPAGALSAWDRYLAAYPRGVFAPEARFNRAICLVRVGRRAEARQVLLRIAEGASGAFGRKRAREILDAME